MIINEILKQWELGENTLILLENIGYEIERERHIWNISNEYILKSTNSEAEIKNNIYIAKVLSKVNIPTQRAIKTINGEDYIEIENKYYGVFTRIEGEVLKNYFNGNYLNRGLYLGQCLANLHKGLDSITEELKESKAIFDNDMIKELDGWVKSEIDSYLLKCKLYNDKIVLFKSIKEVFNNEFKRLYYKLPRQVIHRDFQGENIIFKDNKLVGYIDFDLSQINARLFDICYLCTGALAKGFNKEDIRSEWKEFTKCVIDGYRRESQITEEEEQSIKQMMFAIEFIIIAFFAKEGYDNIADINIEMVNWIEENWDNGL